MVAELVWNGLRIHTFYICVDFCEEDDGQIRRSDSRCEPPSGDNVVRNALVIVCCVLSLLVLGVWSVSAALKRCGVITDTESTQ